jgi:hypothetical protein
MVTTVSDSTAKGSGGSKIVINDDEKSNFVFVELEFDHF